MKAFDHGNAFEWYSLGVRYFYAECVADGKVEAVRWFRKAVEQELSSNDGHLHYSAFKQSAFMLGWCYAKGEGVTNDNVEALKWYRMSAEHGAANAQCELGRCYAKGEILAMDKIEALKWFRKAAEQGSPDARDELDKLLSENPTLREE